MLWRLDLLTWLSRKSKSRANCLARLEVLSCSVLTSMLHTCASFGDLPVTRPYWVHTLELFFTLFHILPLHDSHLNTGYLNAELQVNWHGIKPTKWLIKFNLIVCTLSVWSNVQMTFSRCFLLRWVSNFGDFHVFTFLTCFKHWLCVSHTLPHECLVMHCSCISHAHHMHTTCTLDAHTWSLDVFCNSLMLGKPC